MARARIPASIAALLLALSGCSGDTASGGCRTARDCASGEVCIAGACQAPGGGGGSKGCSSNAQCAADQWCDIVDRSCKALQPIDAGPGGDDTGVSSPDSGEGTPDGGPAPDATAPGDTGPADSGPSICRMDSDCGNPPVTVCVADQCVAGCNQPGGLTCTGGTVCDATTGHCLADMQACQQDSECMPAPPLQICIQSRCVPGCTIDTTLCAAGTEVCNTNDGRCVAVNRPCMQDSECMPGPPDQVCEGGQCVPGCARQGGLQCVGQTPNCNMTSGRCEGVPPCTLDADCGDPAQICLSGTCTVRCDRPGGLACPGTDVCNPESGRCAPGGLVLGDTSCTFDAQCTSDICLGLTRMMMPYNFCSRPCGRSGDCPTDFTCAYVSGMSFCLPEAFFGATATFDTPAGGACMAGSIACQSGWCNTAMNVCLESCSRNSDCASFGGSCWTYGRPPATGTGMLYDHICVDQPGSAAGVACTQNSGCRSGICNRYRSTCASQCCADRDCAANENCVIYDLDPTTSDIVKVCAPRPATQGTAALGATCAMPNDCESGVCVPLDPNDMNSPRRCSTTCCTQSDCTALPGGGKCEAWGGPTVNMQSTIVGICTPR